MAFVWSSTASAEATCDIIAIPAIGADPNATWRLRDSAQTQWVAALGKDIPHARVLVYDHLTAHERSIERKPRSHPEHEKNEEELAKIADAFGESTLDTWVDRLLSAISAQRSNDALGKRPAIFLCHSTGGIVLKAALCRDTLPLLIRASLGIAFFATPHHGSRVLSRPEFARGVSDVLGLKFEMKAPLLREFSAQNSALEELNDRFSDTLRGTRIWNFIETSETLISVLTRALAGEDVIDVGFMVVDLASAVLSTSGLDVEEDVVSLAAPLPGPARQGADSQTGRASHTGAARFADDSVLHRSFVESIKQLVARAGSLDRGSYQALIDSIYSDVMVGAHQFYETNEKAALGEGNRIGVWMEEGNLETFLELGPSKVIQRRLRAGAADSEMQKRDALLRKISQASIFDTVPAIVVYEVGESGQMDGDPIANSEKLQADADRRLTSNPVQRGRSRDRGSEDPVDRYERRAKRAPSQTASFQVPKSDTVRFMWTHVPANVASWVPRILKRISDDKGEPSLHERMWCEWKERDNQSRHSYVHARYNVPHATVLWPNREQHPVLSPTATTHDAPQLELTFPYLFWDTFDTLRRRIAIIKRREKQAYLWPVDPIVLSQKSMEMKLIWHYLTYKLPVHVRRTIDQWGHPSLRNTDARDNDQVLYKKTRGHMPAEHSIGSMLYAGGAPAIRGINLPETVDGPATVLMVDVLWLFNLDKDHVVTFASRRATDSNIAMQADLRECIYRDINGDTEHLCYDSFDFAGLAIYHAVTTFEKATHPNLQVYRIFEEYISELTEDQMASFKDFRDHYQYIGSGDVDLAFEDNSKDLNNLLELRDVEDELGSIRKLLKEQIKIIEDLRRQYEHLNAMGYGRNGALFLRNAKTEVEASLDQVKTMMDSARAAQIAYEKLLDMKQKQSNIAEAQMTRQQGETAAEQSRAVMVFTIWTIIFLPLSFFSSIFGMNVSDWANPSTELNLGFVIKLMIGASVAIIVVALLLAFSAFARSYVLEVRRLVIAAWFGLIGWLRGRRTKRKRKSKAARTAATGRGSDLDVVSFDMLDLELDEETRRMRRRSTMGAHRRRKSQMVAATAAGKRAAERLEEIAWASDKVAADSRTRSVNSGDGSDKASATASRRGSAESDSRFLGKRDH